MLHFFEIKVPTFCCIFINLQQRDFTDISYFPKILSHNSFGNLLGYFYVPYLLLIITLHSHVVKEKFGQTPKNQNVKILWPWL